MPTLLGNYTVGSREHSPVGTKYIHIHLPIQPQKGFLYRRRQLTDTATMVKSAPQCRKNVVVHVRWVSTCTFYVWTNIHTTREKWDWWEWQASKRTWALAVISGCKLIWDFIRHRSKRRAYRGLRHDTASCKGTTVDETENVICHLHEFLSICMSHSQPHL